MRTFKIYSPLMIAKYVSSFFKGQFEVAEQGIFVFDGGKVLIDENSSENLTCSINSQLSCRLSELS